MSFSKSLIYILIIFSLIYCKKKDKENTANTPPPATVVDIIIAKKESLSKEIEANGSVVAKEYVELHPEVSGRLTYLNVPEGNEVSQGTVIARINNADLVAQLEGIKPQLELALITKDRLAKLLSISGVNQADYDAAINQVNTLKANIAYTEALIDKTIIRAPFSGTIGLRQISPGAYVTPTNIIATMQQLSELKIDFTIPEEYGNLLRKGSVVKVLIDRSGNETGKAVIVAIEPQVSATSRNILVRAILKEGKANPGSFVKVYVNSGTDKNSIMVPSNAIIPDDKNKTIIVVKNGKAKFAKIETGERLAGGVEVISGINPGDSVVVTGVLFVRPDGPVKVKSVKKVEDLIR